MLGKLTYSSYDTLNKEYKEPLGYVNLDLSENVQDRVAKAQKIDDFVRAVNALTTNTFKDSEVTYTYNVTDIIVEGSE